MTDLLTSAQMRALEMAAIASGRVTGWRLMMRAGRGAASAIRQHFPAGREAVVLVGPGNNGGDGYVIAHSLAGAGWRVAVFALHPPVTAEAEQAAAMWGNTVHAMADLDWGAFAARPIVIDAMFGTGLSRPVADGVWGALAMAQDAGCPLVAVDSLSGLCADSGRVLASDHIDRPAALTITFQQKRTGHCLDKAAMLSGPVVTVPIGLEGELDVLLRQDGDRVAEQIGPPDVTKHGGHKYDHGHALVVAGPPGHGGAARLGARAALRIGAGLVTLAVPAAARLEYGSCPDALMTRQADSGADLSELLGDARINAVLLGPGLGRDRAPALVRAAAGAGRALVLDADALSGDLPALPPATVLTPHDGEFARMVPDIAARLHAKPDRGPAFSRVDAAREAAARLGAVLVLKGPDTVIAAPDGRVAIHVAAGERAAPWLATAGAGDVLAGMIAGLLARGLPPFDAARAAVWLHVAAALRFGPGLIADDLPDILPAVLAELGA